jgi:hypothetical protein
MNNAPSSSSPVFLNAAAIEYAVATGKPVPTLERISKHRYARALRALAKKHKRESTAGSRKRLKQKRQAEIRREAMARGT